MAKKVNKKRLFKKIRNEVYITQKQQKIISPVGSEDSYIFDFRNIVLQSDYLDAIAEIFWETFESKYPFQVGGLETTAIPLITAIVLKGSQRNKPINGFYIRKERKTYGLQNIIEGKLTNEDVILVDDLMNSGSTFRRQIKILQNTDANVKHIFTLIRFREFESYSNITEKGIEIHSTFSSSDFDLPLKKSRKFQSELRFVWGQKMKHADYFHLRPKSVPALDDKYIYVGSDNGYFWALQQEDGSVHWKKRLGWPVGDNRILSSPTLHINVVYFGSHNGNVYALNKDTGRIVWVYQDADWVDSSPTVAASAGLVFVGLGFVLPQYGAVAALDLNTGNEMWKYPTVGAISSKPRYLPKKQLVIAGSEQGMIHILEAKTGKGVKRFQVKGGVRGSFAVDTNEDRVFFGSIDGNAYVIDLTLGTISTLCRTNAPIYSTPLLTANTLYITSTNKLLYCVDTKTYELHWQTALKGRIFAAPVLVGSRLFCGSSDGVLYTIDPQTGETSEAFHCGERIVDQVVFNENTELIFLQTFGNELYCLRGPDKK